MKTRLLPLILTATLLAAAASTRAGTVWTTPITSNVTFTKAGSPHTWSGNLEINGLGSVTVEPGAIIQFGASQELYVYGKMLALGDPADPIRINGVSDAEPGARLLLQSSQTSEFRHVNFAFFQYIDIVPTSPQGNPLFEHCTFRRMPGHSIYLNQGGGYAAAARILHCIFEPFPGYFGIFHYARNLTPDSVPVIEYNAFTHNALLIRGDSYQNYNLGNFSYFRHNRVGSGIGVQITACVGGDCGGTLNNVLLEDNDLSACTASIHAVFSGGNLLNLTVRNSDLSVVSSAYGPGITTPSFPSNYWGSTDPTAINARVFGGAFSTNNLLPLAMNSWYVQADVDDSEAGQFTRMEDADLVKRSLLGETNLAPAQVTAADVDRDGTVTVRDAMLLESFVRGLVPKLPDP